MSWFSRSFSMMEEEQRGREEDDDKDEEEEEEEEESDLLNLAEIASATGASVKEDLSNLRKTFTRQLWGVASFLAPPPPEKSSPTAEGGRRREGGEEEHESSQEQRAGQQQGNNGEVQGSSVVASEMESQSEQEGFDVENPKLVVSNMSTGGGTSGDALVPEGSHTKETASLRNSNNVSGEKTSTLPGLNRRIERPILTGLRSDFAELRGTVASGISRITSVLREVARDDDSEDEDEDEEEHIPLVSSLESPHPLSSPVNGDEQGLNSPRRSFDSFLKPLFGNILVRERSSGEATIEGKESLAEGEGARRDASARESPSKGESKYRELESLPSAIASGIGGISKFAANLLQIVADEEDEDKDDELEDQDLATGLAEPVVTFARNIAKHPETWLDFPLTEDDPNDAFELTDAQSKHVRALEVAAPELEALKIELCPNYMTEGRFWKIYFVLIYSRLSTNQALMLSSQQVVRAREAMVLELQRRDRQPDELDPHQEVLMYEVENDVGPSQEDTKPANEEFGSRLSIPPTGTLLISNPGVSSFEETRDAAEVSRVDNSMSGSTEEVGLIQAEPNKGRFSMLRLDDETEVDEWPDDELSTREHEIGDPHSHLNTSNLEDEDVSFSDLEEDDSSDKAAHINEEISSSTPKSTASVVVDSTPTVSFVARETSSPSTQGDRTPRKSSERGEFNDWFKVDQDDVGSAGSTSP